MKSFIRVALLFLLTAIAVSIICAKLGGKEASKKNKRLDRRIAAGMALGLLLGVALNYSGLWENHALGLCLGPLWGMALATVYRDGGDGQDGE